MEKRKDVILTDSIENIGKGAYEGYLAHALCIGGSCAFEFNGARFELAQGDLIIIRKCELVDRLSMSADFRVRCLYVSPVFIEQCTLQANYGMKGSMALFLNPVMHLSEEQRYVCERDFRWIEYRLNQCGHCFYDEQLRNAVQSAILDYFDFHSKIYAQESISTQNAAVMEKFIRMLEDGSCRQHREVAWYADVLCITPKYLSEVSKKVSGFAANYWINRYTISDISRQLCDKSLTLAQISDMFCFSSPAYFSRYVQRYLGMNPTEYRE